jgi:hypothetical protein
LAISGNARFWPFFGHFGQNPDFGQNLVWPWSGHGLAMVWTLSVALVSLSLELVSLSPNGSKEVFLML